MVMYKYIIVYVIDMFFKAFVDDHYVFYNEIVIIRNFDYRFTSVTF